MQDLIQQVWVGVQVCVSNQLPGEADAAGPGVAGCRWSHVLLWGLRTIQTRWRALSIYWDEGALEKEGERILRMEETGADASKFCGQ